MQCYKILIFSINEYMCDFSASELQFLYLYEHTIDYTSARHFKGCFKASSSAHTEKKISCDRRMPSKPDTLHIYTDAAALHSQVAQHKLCT